MLYKRNAFALARSVTYKSIWVAFAMNQPIIELGMPIPADKREWRYFMHLNGDRHHIDVPVLITSIDTGELFELTKENLTIHKKTHAFYLDRDNREAIYNIAPLGLELYIEGVFSPIDYEVSISSPDCKVLNYDKHLVESHEVSLIPAIEHMLASEQYQYLSEAYASLYKLFVPWFVSKVASLLVPTIVTHRMSKVHTVETHTELIKEFLKSHKRLHTYLPYLTTNQMLFLYRNLRYIERNPGTIDTLDFLIHNLLTVRNIPIDGFNLAERYSGYQNGGLVKEAIGYKVSMNFHERGQGRDVETYTLNQLIDKEYLLGTEHPRLLDDARDNLDKALPYSRVVNVPTKLLEVSGVDPTLLLGETLLDRLVYEWGYLSAIGTFNAVTDILDPLTGTGLRLTSLESYHLFMYAYNLGFLGIELGTIGNVYSWEQEDGTDYTYDFYENSLPDRASLKRDNHISFYIATHQSIQPNINSTTDFFESVQKRWKNKILRDFDLGSQYSDHDRGEVELLYNINYKYRSVKSLFTGTDYRVFINQLGLDISNYSESIWKDLCHDLMRASIGYDSANVIGFSDIQSKLSELVVKLTGYDIQIVSYVTETEVLSMEPIGALPGEVRASVDSIYSLDNGIGGLPPKTDYKITYASDNLVEYYMDQIIHDEYEYELGFDSDYIYTTDAGTNYNVHLDGGPSIDKG